MKPYEQETAQLKAQPVPTNAESEMGRLALIAAGFIALVWRFLLASRIGHGYLLWWAGLLTIAPMLLVACYSCWRFWRRRRRG